MKMRGTSKNRSKRADLHWDSEESKKSQVLKGPTQVEQQIHRLKRLTSPVIVTHASPNTTHVCDRNNLHSGTRLNTQALAQVLDPAAVVSEDVRLHVLEVGHPQTHGGIFLGQCSSRL